MVLVITNNNDILGLVTKYIRKKDIINQNRFDNLNLYVDKELMNKKLELFDKIIIDINSLKDNNEEIINAIARIKTIYDVQVIILAIGYKVGNELLSELFNIGVYDYIISENKSFQDEEFRKAFKGNRYIDAVKFKVETTLKKKVKKVKLKKIKKQVNKDNKQVSKKKILACFSYIKISISYCLEIVGYVLVMLLLSVGATALINSNIREILIQIIGGI